MRFFRRLAGLLGFSRDDGHEVKDQEDDLHNNNNNNQTPNSRPVFQESGLPRRGFSVPVQVAAARPHTAPLLLPCNSCDGGVQGLKWYAKRLRIDEDGDVADEFLDAVSPENEQKPFPNFQVKYSTRPAIVKTQVMSHDGKIQQCVEYRGRLQLI